MNAREDRFTTTEHDAGLYEAHHGESVDIPEPADREASFTGHVRHMPIAEFRRLGYVQEINRQLLHPCGLALEVSVAADGTETLGGIWDYREDPEGIYYSGDLGDDLSAKAITVAAEQARHADARSQTLGYIVQPIDGTRRQR